MKDQQQSNETVEFLKVIFRKKYWLFGIALLVFLFTFKSIRSNKKFSCSVVFDITNQDFSSPSKIISESSFTTNINYNALKGDRSLLESFASSDQLLKKVVIRLNLIDYYKLNADTVFPILKAAGRLKSNFKIFINPLNEIEVTVQDKDKNMAYTMAIAVMDELNNMNNEYYAKLRRTQYKVCEKQIEYLYKTKMMLLDSMDSYKSSIGKGRINFSDYNKEYREYDGDDKNYMKIIKMTQHLTHLSNNIEDIDRNIINYQNIKFNNLLSLELLSEKAPIILRERVPYGDTPYSKSDYLYPTLGAALSFLGLAMLLHLYNRNRDKIHALFTGR